MNHCKAAIFCLEYCCDLRSLRKNTKLLFLCFFFFFFRDCHVTGKTWFRIRHSLFSRKPARHTPFRSLVFFFFAHAFTRIWEPGMQHVATRFYTWHVVLRSHQNKEIPPSFYLHLLLVFWIQFITYKCVRPILGKNLEAIGHHFHGIDRLDLGKVNT